MQAVIACDEADSDNFVRKHYLSHALETKQQQEYIGNILVRSIGPKELRKMALRRWFRRGFRA